MEKFQNNGIPESKVKALTDGLKNVNGIWKTENDSKAKNEESVRIRDLNDLLKENKIDGETSVADLVGMEKDSNKKTVVIFNNGRL